MAAAVCDGTVRQLQNGLTAYFGFYNPGETAPKSQLSTPAEEQSVL